MTDNYISVSLPKSLIKKLDEVLENTHLGYKSRPDIIKDAVRRHLEHYGIL
jgi:metal-responsive CopG/Arc/MetJ family transcriptional regulator